LAHEGPAAPEPQRGKQEAVTGIGYRFLVFSPLGRHKNPAVLQADATIKMKVLTQ
jgi:hypothetical protein